MGEICALRQLFATIIAGRLQTEEELLGTVQLDEQEAAPETGNGGHVGYPRVSQSAPQALFQPTEQSASELNLNVGLNY